MKHFLYELIGLYALAYLCVYLVFKFDIHSKGCSMCNVVNHDCSCKYLTRRLEPLMEWIRQGLEKDEATPQLVVLVATAPILLGTAFIVTHGFMQYHKNRCLSFVLNGDKE